MVLAKVADVRPPIDLRFLHSSTLLVAHFRALSLCGTFRRTTKGTYTFYE